MKYIPRYFFLLFSFTVVTGLTYSCSHKGLISEKYPDINHIISRPLDLENHDRYPTFIVIGDTQPSYWIKERFFNRRNWYTRRMFIAPFYQIYLFGSGIYGIVDGLRYNPGYGFRGREMVRNAVLDEHKKTKADFLLCTGDFVSDGRHPDHWMRYYHENKIDHPLLDEIPILPVVGNHDYHNDKSYGEKNYREIFGYPPFYKVEFSDAALFIIDSNILIDGWGLIDDDIQDDLFDTWIAAKEGSDKQSWLESELTGTDKTFKIVAMHHSLLSFSRHNSDWRDKDSGRNLEDKRKRLISLLQDQGVTVVFCGHEHLYEHNILKYNDGNGKSQKELHFVVNGSGGVPLRRKSGPGVVKKYQDDYVSQGFDLIRSAYEKMYCFSRVTIDSGKMAIKVFEITDNPEKGVILRDNIVIQKR